MRRDRRVFATNAEASQSPEKQDVYRRFPHLNASELERLVVPSNTYTGSVHQVAPLRYSRRPLHPSKYVIAVLEPDEGDEEDIGDGEASSPTALDKSPAAASSGPAAAISNAVSPAGNDATKPAADAATKPAADAATKPAADAATKPAADAATKPAADAAAKPAADAATKPAADAAAKPAADAATKPAADAAAKPAADAATKPAADAAAKPAADATTKSSDITASQQVLENGTGFEGPPKRLKGLPPATAVDQSVLTTAPTSSTVTPIKRDPSQSILATPPPPPAISTDKDTEDPSQYCTHALANPGDRYCVTCGDALEWSCHSNTKKKASLPRADPDSTMALLNTTRGSLSTRAVSNAENRYLSGSLEDALAAREAYRYDVSPCTCPSLHASHLHSRVEQCTCNRHFSPNTSAYLEPSFATVGYLPLPSRPVTPAYLTEERLPHLLSSPYRSSGGGGGSSSRDVFYRSPLAAAPPPPPSFSSSSVPYYLSPSRY